MARFHSKMVTLCLFVCLLLREEKPILAHTFQWAAALKWVAAQANTPLPSFFSFTVTVFFREELISAILRSTWCEQNFTAP